MKYGISLTYILIRKAGNCDDLNIEEKVRA